MRSLCLLLAVAALQVAADGAPRVISGSPAPDNTGYPFITWQVAVQVQVGNSLSLCGGSIIGDRWVVTAAHCLKDLRSGALQDPQNMQLLPGRTRRSNVGTQHNRGVARYWFHPSYDIGVTQSNRIDLGLIEALDPFNFGLAQTDVKYAAPISMCSGDINSCFPAGASVFVSGYGQQTSGVSSSTAQDLVYANLLAIAQQSCQTKFDTNFGCSNCLPNQDVCAGSDPSSQNKDSCFGDSGGPLVRYLGTPQAPSFQLVGAVSSGTVPAGQTPACGKLGEYGLYVNVFTDQTNGFINQARNGGLNSSAVDNSCIAANTCQSFQPEDPGGFWIFPAFNWQWYYILAIALGGVLVIVLLIAICCCCCRS